MKVLERHATYGPFLERLRSAPARVLLLDYDGTLAPFVVDRTLALPYPEVPPLIVRIMAQGTRVVLISGRPVREVLLLSGISPQPEVWGSHGLERLMADGRRIRTICLPRRHCCGMRDWRIRRRSNREGSLCTGGGWIRQRRRSWPRRFRGSGSLCWTGLHYGCSNLTAVSRFE